MANKLSVDFHLGVQFDGTSTSVTAVFAKAPFLYSSSTSSLNGLNLLNVVPTAVINSTIPGYTGTITTSIIMAGLAVKFDFNPAPAASNSAIEGTFEF